MQVAELVGLTWDGVPVGQCLEVIPDPSWKEVYTPFRQVDVYPNL